MQVANLAGNRQLQVVVVEPHLLHVDEVSNLGGNGARETAARDGKGLQGKELANLGRDLSREAWVLVHPEFKDLGHANHEIEVANDVTVLGVKEDEVGQVRNLGRNAGVEGVSTNVQVLELVEVLKDFAAQGTKVERVTAVKLDEIDEVANRGRNTIVLEGGLSHVKLLETDHLAQPVVTGIANVVDEVVVDIEPTQTTEHTRLGRHTARQQVGTEIELDDDLLVVAEDSLPGTLVIVLEPSTFVQPTQNRPRGAKGKVRPGRGDSIGGLVDAGERVSLNEALVGEGIGRALEPPERRALVGGGIIELGASEESLLLDDVLDARGGRRSGSTAVVAGRRRRGTRHRRTSAAAIRGDDGSHNDANHHHNRRSASIVPTTMIVARALVVLVQRRVFLFVRRRCHGGGWSCGAARRWGCSTNGRRKSLTRPEPVSYTLDLL